MQIGYIRSTRRISQEHAPDVDTRQQCAPQGRRKSHALDVACSVTVSVVNKTRSARIISSADDRGHTIPCSSNTGEGKEVQITARSGSCLKFGVEVEELLVLLLRNSLWREREAVNCTWQVIYHFLFTLFSPLSCRLRASLIHHATQVFDSEVLRRAKLALPNTHNTK